MKTIDVIETSYDIRCLYREANSKPRRALLGYMVQRGYTENLILGGAFHLLGELDKVSKAETYTLRWENKEAAKEIIAIAEAARAGAYRKFALGRWEAKRIAKNICNIMQGSEEDQNAWDA